MTTSREARRERRSQAALAALLLLGLVGAGDAQGSTPAPVPQELRTQRFLVKVDGREANLAHAAAGYYFIGLDLSRHHRTKIEITAPADDYWARGVEVQPWRENVRPEREGAVISFSLDHPAKLSISRPGDHLGGAEMLFLFANVKERKPPRHAAPGLRFYGPGVYHENIDAHTGDAIYLAPGAVIFGSINVWQVRDVRIFGRGVVVYDGPQNPASDDGWKHQRNWHAMVFDQAQNIDVSGITLVTRSRSWMIQMKDSRGIRFDNIKVIGGVEGNANQDGMDWLGGGDTEVTDSFFRASDDVFALQGNWEGYDADALGTPGNDVTHIRIEKSVLSTSISNIVRVNWPHKKFNSSDFVMRDVDVMHMGEGACGVPFALLELWADPSGSGKQTGYHFKDVRLEDWYSLVQIQQSLPAVSDVSFQNVWAFETPSREPSKLSGDVENVHFANVKIAGRRVLQAGQLPLEVVRPANNAVFDQAASSVEAAFAIVPGTKAAVVQARDKIVFDASASRSRAGRKLHYHWLFGDGTAASGRVVRHAFRDGEGTLRDGSGRFRVMLAVTDDAGNTDWETRQVVITKDLAPAVEQQRKLADGVSYKLYSGDWDKLPDFAALYPSEIGVADAISTRALKHGEEYGAVFEGLLLAPADGGYWFQMMARDGARLEIDGTVVAQNPEPWAQVCGTAGNAVQIASGTAALRTGLHRIRVSMMQHAGADAFEVYWQTPGGDLVPMTDGVLLHLNREGEPKMMLTPQSNELMGNGTMHEMGSREEIR